MQDKILKYKIDYNEESWKGIYEIRYKVKKEF